VEEMKARVFELNRMSAAIHEERADLEQKIAAAVAEYQIGQRVIQYGRRHFEITRIGRGYGVGTAKYFGRQVLKAGTLGKQEFELYGRLEPANAQLEGRGAFCRVPLEAFVRQLPF
jgi:hypothetical protein